MKAKAALIGACVAIALIATSKGVAYVTSKMETPPTRDIQGLMILPETFNASCVPEAMRTKTVDYTVASSYCSCVYMTGVQKYGMKEWTQQLEYLGASQTLTTDMNNIVNVCAQEALSQSI